MTKTPFDPAKLALGDTIKARREALGWSITRCSREVGMDLGNYKRIEDGVTRAPRKATLEKIGKALGINLVGETVKRPETWKKQGYVPRFALCRKATGRTLAQAAETLRVQKDTLKKWEACETSPSALVLIRMARLYGVSVDYLIGFDEKPFPGLRCAMNGPCPAGKPIDYCCRDCPEGKHCAAHCQNDPKRCNCIREIAEIEKCRDEGVISDG